MKTASLDDKRRLEMPPECPANSPVTIQQLDPATWVVKLLTHEKKFKSVVIPVVENLSDDPDWDKVEAAFADSAYQKLKEFPPE